MLRAALVGALVSAAQAGYLPVVGPSPIRFAPARSFTNEAIALPAAEIAAIAAPSAQAVDAAAVVTTGLPATNHAAGGSYPVATATLPTQIPTVDAAALSTNVVEVVTAADPIVSSQVLLRYFSRRNLGTNGPISSATSIGAAIGFTLPPPGAPTPSSKATFSTP